MSIEKSGASFQVNPSFSSSQAEAASVSLEVGNIEHGKKKVTIKKGDIDRIAKGLAEVAFSIGQTNNPKDFSSELAEDIMEALKKVKRRQEEKNKKHRG